VTRARTAFDGGFLTPSTMRNRSMSIPRTYPRNRITDGSTEISYLTNKRLFISSCIDRFIHVAFPARCGTVRLRAAFSERMSDMPRVWTCRAGPQRKQYMQYERVSVVFIYIVVHFRHDFLKPLSSMVITASKSSQLIELVLPLWFFPTH
jgi:hypothetical protein